ncbi:hypothetical protein [Halolamina rubra]|uniref:hypothetical protein n=1 Tax=Halolamina rubra TaxID=1380430 RepID=UPI000679091E|nr:hypothetical protein [Halolamina rubra]
MPRARYTADGGTYRVGGISFDPGDEYEVDHELADYLSDHDDFVVSVEKEASPEEDDGDADETDSDENQDDDGDEDGFDAEAFVDRTPMDDVVDDIHAGEADEHLDELSELDDLRVGVQDAIGERRAELEG